MELVTIKESHYSNDLTVHKSRLEFEGIPCTIKDELTSQVLSHIPSMSAKLQVYQNDIPKVNLILSELGEPIIQYHKTKCTFCSSPDVNIDNSLSNNVSTIFSYIKSQLLLTKMEISSKPRKFNCNDCGKSFIV